MAASGLESVDRQVAEVLARGASFEVSIAIQDGDSRSTATSHLGIVVVASDHEFWHCGSKDRHASEGKEGWLYVPIDRAGEKDDDCTMRVIRRPARHWPDYRQGTEDIGTMKPEDYIRLHQLCLDSVVKDPSDTRAWAIGIAVTLVANGVVQSFDQKEGQELRTEVTRSMEWRRHKRRQDMVCWDSPGCPACGVRDYEVDPSEPTDKDYVFDGPDGHLVNFRDYATDVDSDDGELDGENEAASEHGADAEDTAKYVESATEAV